MPAAHAHRVLECTTVEGLGRNHHWVVHVGGGINPLIDSYAARQVSSLSSDLTAYAPPNITQIYGVGVDGGATTGGGEFFVQGSNFGRPEHINDCKKAGGGVDCLAVRYNSTRYQFRAIDCFVKVAHELLECKTQPGTGRNHRWAVSVDGQHSAVFLSNTSYAPPVLTSFEMVEVLHRFFPQYADQIVKLGDRI